MSAYSTPVTKEINDVNDVDKKKKKMQLDVEVSPPASVITLDKYKWRVPKEHWLTFVCKCTLCSYL